MQRKGGIWRPNWGPNQRNRRVGLAKQEQVQKPGKTAREFKSFQVSRSFRRPFFPRQRKRVGFIKQEQPQPSGKTARIFARFRIVVFRPPWQLIWRYGLRRRRVGFVKQEQIQLPWKISREVFRGRIWLFRPPWPFHRRQRKRYNRVVSVFIQLPGKTARIFARLRLTLFRKAFFPRQRVRRIFARISQVQPSGKTAREMAFWRSRKFRLPFFPRQRVRRTFAAVSQVQVSGKTARVLARIRITLFRKPFFPRQRLRRIFSLISQPASPWRPLAGLRWWKLKRKLFRPAQKRRQAPVITSTITLSKPPRNVFLANLLRHWRLWRPRPFRRAVQFIFVPPPPPPPPPPLIEPPTGKVLAIDTVYGGDVVTRSVQNPPFTQDVHVGDFGTTILFDVGLLRLPPKPSLQILFKRPDGLILAKTDPAVYFGTVEVPTYIGTFMASSYVAYVFQPNDLNQPGLWGATLIANGVIVSKLGQFNVLP